MTARPFFLFFILASTLFASRPALALLPYIDSETAVPVERGKSRLDLSMQDDRWSHRLSIYGLKAELSYGLINNLEFSVNAPYLFRRVKGPGKVDGVGNEDGLGDLTLKAKIRFIKGREATPVSIAGQLSVKFPSCDDHKKLSQECTGEPDVGLRAIASKEFFPVTVHLNLGYIFIGNPPNSNLDNVLTYSLAFDYVTVVNDLRVAGELAGETNRDPDTPEDPLAALIGLLYDVDMTKVLTLAGSVGLTKASPDFSLSAGFRYLF
jgi:Putative MetA-pathway of phenol degradation